LLCTKTSLWLAEPLPETVGKEINRVDSYKSVASAQTLVQVPGQTSTLTAVGNVVEPHLRFYKSLAGYNAIMSWYEDALDGIDIELSSRYVETRFGRTHMLVCGREDAPPLLLLPGTAGCAPLWRNQFAEFAKHFRVYALDVIGQPGRSEANILSLLGDAPVVWLKDVLDELGIEKAHFAGNSVGGAMAMRMGIEAPERVNKVVMLGPTGLTRAKLPVKIWLSKVVSKKKDANALEDDLTATSIKTESPKGTFGTFDRQLARLMALCTRHYRVDRSLDVYNQRSGKIDLRKGLGVLRKFFMAERKSYLRQFKVPGLLIFGEHEMFFNPNKVAARSEQVMPGLESIVVDNAGHGAVFDQPAEVNRLVVEFLNR
jgi:pimeloyl-ACP methyl ester carboxylesterase